MSKEKFCKAIGITCYNVNRFTSNSKSIAGDGLVWSDVTQYSSFNKTRKLQLLMHKGGKGNIPISIFHYLSDVLEIVPKLTEEYNSKALTKQRFISVNMY